METLGKIYLRDTDLDLDRATDDMVWVYDNYDKSYVQFLDMKYKGQKVPKVFATPERAFSQYAELLAKTRGINIETINKGTIPLPMISVNMSDASYDGKRDNWNEIRKGYYAKLVKTPEGKRIYKPVNLEEEDPEFVIGCKYPIPYNLVYKIEIWTKTLLEARAIQAQYMRKFQGQIACFAVAHPLPLGNMKIIARLGTMLDNSDLEPTENNRTVIRFTISTTLDGWLHHPAIVRKTVKSVVLDESIVESDGTETVDFSQVVMDSDIYRQLNY